MGLSTQCRGVRRSCQSAPAESMSFASQIVALGPDSGGGAESKAGNATAVSETDKNAGIFDSSPQDDAAYLDDDLYGATTATSWRCGKCLMVFKDKEQLGNSHN